MIKQIIREKKSDTAPGEDGLLYGILSRLPSSHWFLATLYNKIDEDGIAPSSWTGCLLSLILKAGSPEDPSNFRPIALSSILGKIFHHIKANQLSEFMLKKQLH